MEGPREGSILGYMTVGATDQQTMMIQKYNQKPELQIIQ